MKPITVWKTIFKESIKHNHIEDGHVEGEKPISRFDM